jgi:hypothetical protein
MQHHRAALDATVDAAGACCASSPPAAGVWHGLVKTRLRHLNCILETGATGLLAPEPAAYRFLLPFKEIMVRYLGVAGRYPSISIQAIAVAWTKGRYNAFSLGFLSTGSMRTGSLNLSTV